MKPKVTVLMSVYNGERYLKEAVDSILNQSLKDFEFLIINDGSTDDSEDIIKSYKDRRIRLVNNDKNIGLIRSLNKGIELANGKYIARMDADDISLPERLEKEFLFLERNPDYIVVGTDSIFIDEKGSFIKKWPSLSKDKLIKIALLFTSPFVHGSVMIRKDVLKYSGLYDKNAYVAEDYDLWCRLVKFGNFGNINEYLYKYRVNSKGESAKKREDQQKSSKKISLRYFETNKNIFDVQTFDNFFSCTDDKDINYINYLKLLLLRKLRSLNKMYFYCWSLWFNSLIKNPGYVLNYFYAMSLLLPFVFFEKIENFFLRLKFS